MKILLIAASVIVGIICAVFIFFYFAIPDFEPVYKIKEIKFDNSNAVLFYKTKTWGITGDHSVSFLSPSSEKERFPDSTKNYVYKQPSFTGYRTSNDTLWLYVYSKAPVPQFFDSKIRVMQVELENLEMMAIRKTNL